jgi:hypothetical protein
MQSIASCSSSLPVSTTMGTSLATSRTVFTVSTPAQSGRRRSSTTTSTGRVRSVSTAVDISGTCTMS